MEARKAAATAGAWWLQEGTGNAVPVSVRGQKERLQEWLPGFGELGRFCS